MTAGVWGEAIPNWLPFSGLFQSEVGALRGIVELGVALTLGVLLDTFIVRPILVPAFMSVLAQFQAKRQRLIRPRRRHHAHRPHKPRKSVEQSVER
jgi:RND superfamily putative drug exporter